mmetsp:Transcript_43533/g.114915  ORF Transcript_43533/g.114915 Transcript_43533/m.114915 type:complete len:235 (-) Transcript_43533:1442-2146(-)
MLRGVVSRWNATSATCSNTGANCTSSSRAKPQAETTPPRKPTFTFDMSSPCLSMNLLSCSPGILVITIQTLQEFARFSVSCAINAGSRQRTSSEAFLLRLLRSSPSTSASATAPLCQQGILLMATSPCTELSPPHTTPKLPLPRASVTWNCCPSMSNIWSGPGSPQCDAFGAGGSSTEAIWSGGGTVVIVGSLTSVTGCFACFVPGKHCWLDRRPLAPNFVWVDGRIRGLVIEF